MNIFIVMVLKKFNGFAGRYATAGGEGAQMRFSSIGALSGRKDRFDVEPVLHLQWAV
jgi:hypothetical protein